MNVLVVGAAALFDHIYFVRELPSQGCVAEIIGKPSFDDCIHFGGTAFNIAMTMAKLGVACGVMHMVGGDFPGSGYESWLMEQGVFLEGITVVPDMVSGHAFLFHDLEGKTLCFSYPGAANEPLPLEGASELVSQVDIMIIAPVFTHSTARLVALAKQHGVKIGACGISTSELIPYLSDLEILIANQYETRQLFEAAGVEYPRELLNKGPSLIYETHGKHGSCLFSAAGEKWIAATPPRETVDPTGAGDSYAGAVLASLLKGFEPAKAGLIGSIASSYVVEKVGCQTNLPSWDQVMSRLEEHYPQELSEVIALRENIG